MGKVVNTSPTKTLPFLCLYIFKVTANVTIPSATQVRQNLGAYFNNFAMGNLAMDAAVAFKCGGVFDEACISTVGLLNPASIPPVFLWLALLNDPSDRYAQQAADLGLFGATADKASASLPSWVNIVSSVAAAGDNGGNVAGVISLFNGASVLKQAATTGMVLGYVSASISCATGKACLGPAIEATISAIPYVGQAYFVFKLISFTTPGSIEISGHGGGGFKDGDPGTPILLA
jgi:hypothetical protein